MLWYLAMAAIVVGGVFLIVYSRNERLHPASAAVVPPTKNDNWHAAFALDVCGTVQPKLAANSNLSVAGLRTFGDGIIDVDPGAASDPAAFTGVHDTLGNFATTYGLGFAISKGSLTLPGKTRPASTTTTTASTTTTTASTTTTTAPSTTTSKPTSSTKPSSSTTTPSTTVAPSTTTTTPITPGPSYKNGAACPSSSKTPGKAELQTMVWSSPTAKGHLYKGNPADLKIENGEMITLAFVPAKATIPAPPWRSTLLSDLGGTSSSG